ncbi:MAG: hypothetical protein IJY70_02855, partial [Clostridia bacterium]|nr:hypothetical protein [Clostridia bacterium]
VALISISDCDLDFAKLTYKPQNLIQVKFNDVDSDIFFDEFNRKLPIEDIKRIKLKYSMFSGTIAKQIANFYFSIEHNAKILICQCEHGQSRSAAIAAAIMQYRSKNGIDIFSHDKYYPNKYVFRKMLRYLNENK